MQTENSSNALVYQIEDRPPFLQSLFAAVQHLLAIFVAIITPPLIIASALQLDTETTGFLVSMALFASGISTIIQCRGVGPVGARLLCIQGTSFSFIGPIIAAGLSGGLPLIFGCCIAAAPIEMLISRVLGYTKRVITPLVSGVVVMLIGLSLLKVSIISCGGGYGALENGTFGSMENLLLAFVVIFTIIVFNSVGGKYLRMSSIAIGLIVGTVLAYFMGRIEPMSVTNFDLFNIPTPVKYGLDFEIGSFIGIAIVYVITSIEAYGDISANSMVSGLPIKGDGFVTRLKGGILADGLNSFISGLFNSFPNSIFSQNNGIIQLTGIASRHIGYYIAALLLILGFFPIVGITFTLIPDAVLGGGTLLLFGTVSVAGIRILSTQKINKKATLVIALSLGAGLGVELNAQILSQFPQTIQDIFNSGITTGGIVAILSNLLIPSKD